MTYEKSCGPTNKPFCQKRWVQQIIYAAPNLLSNQTWG